MCARPGKEKERTNDASFLTFSGKEEWRKCVRWGVEQEKEGKKATSFHSRKEKKKCTQWRAPIIAAMARKEQRLGPPLAPEKSSDAPGTMTFEGKGGGGREPTTLWPFAPQERRKLERLDDPGPERQENCDSEKREKRREGDDSQYRTRSTAAWGGGEGDYSPLNELERGGRRGEGGGAYSAMISCSLGRGKSRSRGLDGGDFLLGRAGEKKKKRRRSADC